MTAFDHRTSDTFRVANLIAIFLVVAIHYNSKHYIDLSSGLGFNYYFQEWLTNSVARVSVPFFAFVAGFFYYLKFRTVRDYLPQLQKRFWSLIVPYFIAVLVILVHDNALAVLKNQGHQLAPAELGYYLLHPDSVQFWFLRDLIFIVIFICPILHLVMNKLPALVLAPLFIAWFIEFQFFPKLADWYLINVEILFFFSVGCFLAKNTDKLKSILSWCESFSMAIIFLFLVLSVGRVLWAPKFAVWYGVHGGGIGPLILYKLVILVGLLALYVSSLPLKNSRVLIWLSTFSFFIFLYHIKPVSTISINLASFFLKDPYIFYLSFPYALGMSIFFGYTLKAALPRIYSYVSGGR
ncbi:acyltransferase family protein [Marinobacter sp.]|uniref:acyltransferase family protein n=1 Tax=Marinobacter sp. TaxID=50741 RepID=UPI003A93CD96